MIHQRDRSDSLTWKTVVVGWYMASPMNRKALHSWGSLGVGADDQLHANGLFSHEGSQAQWIIVTVDVLQGCAKRAN